MGETALSDSVTTYVDTLNGFSVPIPPGFGRDVPGSDGNAVVYRSLEDVIEISVGPTPAMVDGKPELTAFFESFGLKLPGDRDSGPSEDPYFGAGEVWATLGGSDGTLLLMFRLCDPSKVAKINWTVGPNMGEEFAEFFTVFRPRPARLNCRAVDIGEFYPEEANEDVLPPGQAGLPDPDAIASGWGLIGQAYYERNSPDGTLSYSSARSWWSAPEVGGGRHDIIAIAETSGLDIGDHAVMRFRWISEPANRTPYGVTIVVRFDPINDRDFEVPTAVASRGSEEEEFEDFPGRWTRRGANEFAFTFDRNADAGHLSKLLTDHSIRIQANLTDGASVVMTLSHDGPTHAMMTGVLQEWGVTTP